jgi:chromosome segregation ATPase
MRWLLSLLVEPAMYFAIGFLLAALLSLPFLGMAHRRAVRLTTRDLDSQLPLAVNELRAEKDLLRSEFAVETTRLAGTLDDVKAKAAAHRAEIGRQGGTVASLKAALGEKARTIAALEARETALQSQMRATEREHALKSISLDDARRALANKQAELARLMTDLGQRAVIADHQNIELAKTRVNVEALKATVDDLNREVDALNARLVQARDDSDKASRELADERGKVGNLGRRIADLEIELIAQRDAAEALSKVTADRITGQAQLLAAREYEADRLRIALDGAHRAEAALRYECAQVEERRLIESKAALADKAALEIEIGTLKQDRQRLEWELRTLRSEAEKSLAAERIESALMRGRINEFGEQIALLRSVLPAAPPHARNGNGAHVMNGGANGSGLNGHDLAGVAAE